MKWDILPEVLCGKGSVARGFFGFKVFKKSMGAPWSRRWRNKKISLLNSPKDSNTQPLGRCYTEIMVLSQQDRPSGAVLRVYLKSLLLDVCENHTKRVHESLKWLKVRLSHWLFSFNSLVKGINEGCLQGFVQSRPYSYKCPLVRWCHASCFIDKSNKLNFYVVSKLFELCSGFEINFASTFLVGFPRLFRAANLI